MQGNLYKACVTRSRLHREVRNNMYSKLKGRKRKLGYVQFIMNLFLLKLNKVFGNLSVLVAREL